VFGQLRDPFRQQRDLHISAARVLLMQLELLEIRRSGVLSHKRSAYCRRSRGNRKLGFASTAAALLEHVEQIHSAGPQPTTAATTRLDGATRKIVFDGIRELLMSV
jgi:hypothetical protein